MSTFLVFFSVVHLAVHMHTMNLLKILLTKKNLEKFVFTFSPQN